MRRNITGAAALAFSALGLVVGAPAALAAAVHQLDYTENSTNSLSVTWDGSTAGVTVIGLGGGEWGVTLPDAKARQRLFCPRRLSRSRLRQP